MSLTNLSQIEHCNDSIIDKVQNSKRRLNVEEVPSLIWYPSIIKWQKTLRLSCQELAEMQYQKDFQKRKDAYRREWTKLMNYFFNDFDSDSSLEHIKDYYKEFEEIEDDIYDFKSLSERKIRVALLATLHKLLDKLIENDFSSYLELASLTIEEELKVRPLKSAKELTCRQIAWVLLLCDGRMTSENLKSFLAENDMHVDNLDSVTKHFNVYYVDQRIRNNDAADNERKRAEKDLRAVINYLNFVGKENALGKAINLIQQVK